MSGKKACLLRLCQISAISHRRRDYGDTVLRQKSAARILLESTLGGGYRFCRFLVFPNDRLWLPGD